MKRLSLVTILLAVATSFAAHGQVRPTLLGINDDAFFDDTVLHEIRLSINSRDWQTLKELSHLNAYYPADFRWRDRVVRNIGIRSRGLGSRSGVKPALRVDFDRYTTDQKFLGLKSFVLGNGLQDPSNLRERISMLLFRRMGVLAPREAHTKLYVNDEYVGLFTIVESIDKKFLSRTLKEDDGYLFDYEYPSQPYYFEDRGSDPEAYVPVPFRPATHEHDPKPEFVAELIQTINQTGDAAFRIAMAEYLDLAKFIRYVAVERFLADDDGILGEFGVNNFYLYRFQNTKLFTFIAWDKSNAFSSHAYSIWQNVTTGTPGWQQNRLMARAISHADLYHLYLDTLLECLRSVSEVDAESTNGRGWLEREIEREYAHVREAALADPAKPFSNQDFEDGVNALRAFARLRSDFVAAEVSAARLQPNEVRTIRVQPVGRPGQKADAMSSIRKGNATRPAPPAAPR